MARVLETLDDFLKGIRYGAFAYFAVLMLIANKIHTTPPSSTSDGLAILGYVLLVLLCATYYWRNRKTAEGAPLFVGLFMSCLALAIILGFRLNTTV